MTKRTVDVAIIGAGTAGMAAYRTAVAETDSVLLIEGGAYGTTCARVGCMPSKLMIAAAEAAHAGRRTDAFGIHYDAPRIDGQAVMRRIRSERDRFVAHVVKAVERWPDEHRARAMARFVDADTLALEGGDRIQADRIVIATGSAPVVPEPFRAAGRALATSDDLFDWPTLPRSVAVFGAGVIGLELGQALHRLGVRTVLFGKGGAIGQLGDPAVLDAARAILCSELDFHPDHALDTLEPGDGGARIAWRSASGGGDEIFERVVVAVGRAPSLGGLDLAATGLSLDDNGVPESDPATGRCGESRIFIAGDADAREPLLHVAADDGKTAGTNAGRFPHLNRTGPTARLSITFSDPQIAIAGQGYRALEADGAAFEAGAIDWTDQGRASVMLQNRGLTRIYGQRETGRLLGAEMVGPSAEHLAHLLAWAIDRGETVGDVLAHPFYHPCLEEGLRTALRKLNTALGLAEGPLVPRCLDCGPGA